MAEVPMAPNVTLIFGPMLIGVFFNMILYGILIVQTYHYYLSYKGDVHWIRCLVSEVLYLFVIETVNTGCDMAMMYQTLINNFGKADTTKFFPTLLAAEPITIVRPSRVGRTMGITIQLQVVISTPIQLFFAYRIRLLSKSNLLGGIIAFFATVSLGGGAWSTVRIVKTKVFAHKPELHLPALVWLLSAVVSDVMITVVLVITLNKRRTGFIATDDAIAKIIRMTVQTGLLTSLFAIGDVIFFMTLPHTAVNFVWDLALTKLYSNCLLSTLNTRAELKESSGPRQLSLSGNVGMDMREFNLPTQASPPFYELNTPKSSEGYQTRTPDLEYGITVTTVVETKGDTNSSCSA
ncbi:uncharacterized protein LACBIDRAFT_299921 [Laccaria bicolor S238N-H82]|uniref:Predicted protein n=1 Tax=Laccaria bicolor (strain S238N-H82 / ATCC MYA-4686) TaxID=486041 RepID=B0DFM5_LACBS|nr:uncharacterized protein LACBIDRAFT_299921 [Laccaria bicolor S238N-H82]EDR06369.1 predicted protein [Laccaria bicolor S238N-H82]|eukprot:XP_001882741.1 predicted protein [Laccaria bicolor S238N-H82]